MTESAQEEEVTITRWTKDENGNVIPQFDAKKTTTVTSKKQNKGLQSSSFIAPKAKKPAVQ